jgi:peptidoglycan/LPS O-acetylase OafA/YrhL
VIDGGARTEYRAVMVRLLRFALLAVIGLLMLTDVVFGLGTTHTGPIEKVVLIAFGVILVMAAVRVSRLGRPAADLSS